jgi:tRNA-Thr(GGU) m(6)t(6)A37 methyltransferase TsaA
MTETGRSEADGAEGGTGGASYVVRPVGRVESPLTDPALAPCQGDEGAPDAWLVLDPDMAAAMTGLEEGAEVIVLTWLDRASRDVYQVHPRGDYNRPLQGVFNTRSPDRPNPIGLHTVVITAIRGTRIGVTNLEAIDGTPVLDIKPVIGTVGQR